MSKDRGIPFVGDEPINGVDCYVPSSRVPEHGIRRRWSYRGETRSVEWQGGGVVKARDAFEDHATDAELVALLQEAAARGVVRPSSYGDLFHQRSFQGPTRASYRKMFPQVPGGWQSVYDEQGNEAQRNYIIRRPLWLYDIKSAYLWSMSLGLPHPETFCHVKRVTGPGLYWCPSPGNPALPYPWNAEGIYPATEDELITLPLPFRDIRYGVAFVPGTWAVSRWVREISEWSCHKAIGRAFWGRWGATGRTKVETLRPDGEVNTERELSDSMRNPIWAALITARLRQRIWPLFRQKRRIFRVFVDSVVTDEPLDTGEKMGEWVEKEQYLHGGIIHVEGVTSLRAA